MKYQFVIDLECADTVAPYEAKIWLTKILSANTRDYSVSDFEVSDEYDVKRRLVPPGLTLCVKCGWNHEANDICVKH